MEVHKLLLAILLWKGAFVFAGVGDASSSVQEADEPCGPPGAVRCDAWARVLNVCGDDGAWTPAEDCAAHGRVCFDGRCLDVNLTRAVESCTHGSDTTRCSTDCSSVEYCNQFNVWATQIPCSNGQACQGSQCVIPDSSFTCGSLPENNIICYSEGRYPDIRASRCTLFFECSKNGNGVLSSALRVCPSGYEFDACTGDCTTVQNTERCSYVYDDCNPTLNSYVVLTNPSLYYTCSTTKTLWNKCQSGYYFVPQFGKCMDGFTGCGNGGNGGNGGGSCSCPSSPSNCQLTSGSTCSFCHCANGDCEILKCNNGNYFNPSVGRCVSGSCQP